VHVNLLRGKMLAMLMDAHRVSQLKFFYTHAGFADRSAFQALLRSLRQIKWVV
jgi:hypothetical protein